MKNDSYKGIGRGAIDYRDHRPAKDQNMAKDGSARGRKPAKGEYGGSANVRQDRSRSFESSTRRKPSKKNKMPYT